MEGVERRERRGSDPLNSELKRVKRAVGMQRAQHEGHDRLKSQTAHDEIYRVACDETLGIPIPKVSFLLQLYEYQVHRTPHTSNLTAFSFTTYHGSCSVEASFIFVAFSVALQSTSSLGRSVRFQKGL